MKNLMCGLLALMFAFTGLNMTAKAARAETVKPDKAIVVTSFGTTFPEVRKACIGGVEEKIAKSFPDYQVHRAFTARIVIKRVAEKENIKIPTLEQKLDELKQAGVKEVVIQPTHLTPGEEYENKIMRVAAKYMNDFAKISVGRPVLVFDGHNGRPDDFAVAVQAIKNQMPKLGAKDCVVFLGHGSPHQPNPAYQAIQDAFDEAKINAVVGVVEEDDKPNLEDVKTLLKKRGYKNITLMPLMLVAGDHAHNDMAGDEEDSWKSELQKEGFKIKGSYLKGLGQNSAFQDIYVQHVKDAIQGINSWVLK